jgi:ATP adenylyltransferase
MKNNYLYSPWRLDYIISEQPDDCILCRVQFAGTDKENLIVHRGNFCYVMLNRYPYNNGHLMIVPAMHMKDLQDMSEMLLLELAQVVQISEEALKNAYHCDGINIGINIGKAAGAGIDEHLHIHMVPRWNGDSNFMSVVAGERVIPEDFNLTYTRLRKEYTKLMKRND